MSCKNCSSEANHNYCPNCGQAVAVKRIDGHYVYHEIEHILHFERGILYTIKELLINPGENIRQFLAENRTRLVKPIVFIVVTSLIYSLVNHFFHFEDNYVQLENVPQTSMAAIFRWIQNHYGYANIIMGIFIALWTKIFFRKYGCNFFEILILLCFTIGIGMLIFAFFAMIQGLAHIDMLQTATVLGVGYCTWAIGQFFDRKRPASYFRAFAAYMLGMITFMLSAIVLGGLIDSLILT